MSDSVASDDSRVAALRSEVAGLRVPAGVPAAERRLLVVSVALGALGAAAQQLPYVISGGLVGVALVVTGAVLFARYSLARLARFWLARLIVEQQDQTDRIIAAIDQLDRPEPR